MYSVATTSYISSLPQSSGSSTGTTSQFTSNTVNFTNDVSINNRLFVGGDVSFNSKLYVVGDVSLNNRLFVNGDVSFNGSYFYVKGDSSFNSNITVTGNITSQNITTMNNNITTLQNSQAATTNSIITQFTPSVVTFTGDISLNNRLFVNGDVSFNRKLYVIGDVSINNRLFVNGDVSFNSSHFYVGGDTSLNGNVTIKSSLTAPIITTINDNIALINGNVTTTNNNLNLAIGNITTLQNIPNVNTSTAISFSSSSITVTGDLTVNKRCFVVQEVSLNGLTNFVNFTNQDLLKSGKNANCTQFGDSRSLANANTASKDNVAIGRDTMLNLVGGDRKSVV
jgi:hydroxyacyl-ACP dehydratase HTD2-like protein with hotdog domain